MITYVTYREATFKTMGAFELGRERAEAAGWFVSRIDWRASGGGTVLFGFEQDVESTNGAAAAELPEFERDVRRSSQANESSGSRLRGSASAIVRWCTGSFRRRAPAAPLVPRIRECPRHGR